MSSFDPNPDHWDANKNGIPDWRDPAYLRPLWWGLCLVVRAFAPAHTIVRRGVEDIDRQVRGVTGGTGAGQ